MAKTSETEKVNKSAAIREVLEQDIKTPIKDVVARLAEQNIIVAPSAVYMVRRALKIKKRKEARAQTAEKAPRSPNTVALILKVKSLAAQAGGLNNLKELVDALSQ